MGRRRAVRRRRAQRITFNRLKGTAAGSASFGSGGGSWEAYEMRAMAETTFQDSADKSEVLESDAFMHQIPEKMMHLCIKIQGI